METNEIIKALELAASKVYHSDMISKLHDCNDCKDRDCTHRPRIGEMVRINCFAWKG